MSTENMRKPELAHAVMGPVMCRVQQQCRIGVLNRIAEYGVAGKATIHF